ncbi:MULTISPECIES: energy-coupling factor ABC transporter ATP-binding protein [Lactobacillus]|uniref:energy-coupling factor ABC transporter ATP-binding protein n=1 Tax=Lactobacillus TaxID=1578 RepID=UPI000D6F69A1|nr:MULTISPECIES: energy-coupling factor ABC transporter ATP-binding protein [Lactobacillus]AWN33851.1 energy-coupling factor ABC transporter ATP-binding protein [Lactobacillus helsingborgensis]RMC52252.1 energy-coupling factor transporter ATPase [Lactobacillus sp. ESL0262]
MATDSIIKIKNVSFSYPESDKPAIDNISFEVERGSWTSIIGHNGSGKSTIIRLINGLLVPDEKENSLIEVDGIKLNDDTVWDIRDKVGVVFQNPDNQFVGATVADDVAFGLENRGVPHEQMVKTVAEAIKAVGMSEYANSEPANLSGGQKQRIAIAGILAIRPKIIVLDEATSMLDPEGRDKILKIVRQMKDEYNLTVISITHDIDEANMADQVLVMNDGKLITEGSTKTVFSQVELLKKLGLDVPFFEQIKAKLLNDSMKIPASVDSEKELINFLCQLNSKM